MSEPVFVSLMRHGPTVWNADKRIQGITDTPLSREGEALALKWGRQLFDRGKEHGYERIVSSDLDRAHRTARLINRFLKLPIDLDDRLREQDWGEWTGRRIRDLREENPQAVEEQEAKGWKFRPPGGEDRLSVLGRVCAALEHLAARCSGERVLVVTHQGVLKCMLYRMLDMRFLPEEGDPLEKYRLHTLTVDPRPMAALDADFGAGITLEKLNEEF